MTSFSNRNRITIAAQRADADDDFLWLEDLHGEAALQWVTQENQRTLAQYAQGRNFPKLERQVLDILNKGSRIPWVSKLGEDYYNFWQDQANPRGVLRRTTQREYRKAEPAWETVLDIDALGKTEGKDWVYHGPQPLAPEYRYSLIALSPDGGDAVEIREFDLIAKRFVANGFNLPLAKSDVSWIDQETLFIATDFGPGSMTRSGYPRIAKRWRRGTPLSAAETVFGAQPEDLTVFAYHDHTPGFERDYVGRSLDFYRRDAYWLTALNQQINIAIPQDAEFSTHREWLLIKLSREWEVEGRRYTSGALLAAKFDAYLAGQSQLQILFTPDAQKALSDFSSTRDHLILSIMENVTSRLEVLTPWGSIGNAGRSATSKRSTPFPPGGLMKKVMIIP